MDILSILQPLLSGAAAFLGGPQLVAATVSQIVLRILQEIHFDPDQAIEKLAKVGFKISRNLLPELVQAANRGAKALSDWFEARLGSLAEINESATKMLIQLAKPVAEAVQQSQATDKAQVSETMKEGLAHYGGATAQIADAYSKVLQDINRLDELVAEMQTKVDAWANQTVEAKNNSLIRGVWQSQEGMAGNQEVRATDHSTVENVTQSMKGSTPPFPAPPPKPPETT